MRKDGQGAAVNHIYMKRVNQQSHTASKLIKTPDTKQYSAWHRVNLISHPAHSIFHYSTNLQRDLKSQWIPFIAAL